MSNYYIFLCMDNIPFLELILDKNKKSITNYQKIDWNNIKYIILNFKSNFSNGEAIKKGNILYKDEILTKQLIYFQINIRKTHNSFEKNMSKKNAKIIELSEKLFYEEPSSFVQYMKEKKLFTQSEILKFEETLKIWEEEKEMINSWRVLKEQKK